MWIEIELSDLEYRRVKRLAESGRMLNPSADPARIAKESLMAGLRVLEREHTMSEQAYANLDDEIAEELIKRVAQRGLVDGFVRSVGYWNDVVAPGRTVSYRAPSTSHRTGEPYEFTGRVAGAAVLVDNRALVPLDNGVLVPIANCTLHRGAGFAVPMVPHMPEGWHCDRCGLPLEAGPRWCWDTRNWRHDCPPVRQVLAEVGERPSQEPDAKG